MQITWRKTSIGVVSKHYADQKAHANDKGKMEKPLWKIKTYKL